MPIRSASLLLLVLAFATGCAQRQTETRLATTSAEDPPAPGQRALRLAQGAGAPRYAPLLQEQGARRLWRSADGLALQTDGPRITATSGFAQVIVATRLDGPDPLATPEALLAREAPALRLIDLGTADRDPARMRFGVEIACQLRATAEDAAPEELEVREECRGPAGIGSFTNRFTLRRRDGALLRSVQWIGPGLPPLATGPIP